MTTRPPLPVYLYGHLVAEVLDTGDGGAALRYTEEGVGRGPRSRLSLSLPVQLDLHPSFGPGGRWVRSLLPEGRALAWAVQEFGIPEDDRYGLIAALGADCAGAVQILLPGKTPAQDGHYEALGTDAVNDIVGRAHQFGLGLNRARGVRLSLPGVQDKVLLHASDQGYLRPIDGAPSTLIVKPQPPVRTDEPPFDGLPSNELLCLVLARLAGLRVAEARVEHFGPTPALVITRYDRRIDAVGDVHRVHQEDLLSALGQDPLLKYERPLVQRSAPVGGFADAVAVTARPGPTLSSLAQLLEQHLGIAMLRPFVQAVTFNVVIGNADAHARNYSVLLAEDGTVELAPLYDLVCTRYWDHLDPEAAQLVSGKDHIDDIRAQDVMDETTSWGIPASLAGRWVHETIDRVIATLATAADASIGLGADPNTTESMVTLLRSRLAALR